MSHYSLELKNELLWLKKEYNATADLLPLENESLVLRGTVKLLYCPGVKGIVSQD
jgi:hypothetical protein